MDAALLCLYSFGVWLGVPDCFRIRHYLHEFGMCTDIVTCGVAEIFRQEQ